MKLWSDELEAMRPRLREEADAFIASFTSELDDPSLPVPERIARQRAVADERVMHSEMAVDREIPGPAGPDDCEAAALWVLEHAERELGSDRLLIGGESAGAHLAACTLLRLRDRHDAVDRFGAANLVFGIYDLGGTPSQRAMTERPDLLTAEQIEYFTELFTPGRSVEERRDPDISPLYADLHGLPPALFTVGADDHLVDDTLFMAARWALAGNQAELLVYPETPHGGIGMPSVFEPWFATLTNFLRRPANGG